MDTSNQNTSNQTQHISNRNRSGQMGGNGNYFQNAIEQEIQKTQSKLQFLNQTYDDFISFEQGTNEEFLDRLNRNRGGGNMNRGRSMSGGGGGNGHLDRNQDGSIDGRQFNTGRRNFSGGSNDASDDRTDAGRMAHDAEDFTQDELYNFLSNPDQNDLNDDGTFDRRTKVGRALYAAGLIDENGAPIEENVGAGNSQNRGRSGRGTNMGSGGSHRTRSNSNRD